MYGSASHFYGLLPSARCYVCLQLSLTSFLAVKAMLVARRVADSASLSVCIVTVMLFF